ncbi:Flp pilus assembly complex ATPase component TadA [Candidatus Uhrbacteria bacterium]|nr:Flp pilus assembly complex ATPase component TadA [Candidatus Uhrbacteria bacterium]
MDTAQSLIFKRLLTDAAKKEASDLHLSVGSRPMIRVDGALRVMDDEDMMTQESLKGIVDAVTTDEQRAELNTKKDLIFTTVFDNRIRAKIHIFFQEGFFTVSLRFLSVNVKTLREMKLPESLFHFTHLQDGLVIIGGDNGSGRTTLAAAFLEEINRSSVKHILTVEDPIEYNLVSNKSIVNQREVGRDVPSIEEGLVYAQKEDVDAVFICDLGNERVIRKALELADAGILVFVIMNTNSSLTAIERIISSFDEHEQVLIRELLAQVLRGIIIQSLVPKIGGSFVTVHEVLLNNAAVKTFIQSNRLQQLPQVIKASRAEGMMSFDHELAKYVKDQEVTAEQAREVAKDKQTLELLLHT